MARALIRSAGRGAQSVLKPAIPDVFRDPSIARDESGTYHLGGRHLRHIQGSWNSHDALTPN